MALEDDILEIKKEIVQTHNLIIKSDNLTKNLQADLKQIQKKQDGYERKYWINSVWSYILFAALAFAGVYIAFEAKIGAAKKERDELERQLLKVRSEAEDLQQKLSVRSQQEKAVEELLRLKRENRDEDALKAADGLDPNQLSPVLGRLFSRETEELRQKMAREYIEEGKSLFSRGQLRRAQQELDRALEVHPVGGLLAEVQQQRGAVLLKLGANAPAAEAYLAAAEADPKSEEADDALFQAAGAQEKAGDIPQALEAYRRLLADYPESSFASQARRRLSKLEREGGLTPTPQPQPSPAPEAPAPAPAATAPALPTPVPASSTAPTPAVDGGSPAR